jgi:hypothetical protein
MCNYFALTSPTLLAQICARRELEANPAPFSHSGRRAGDVGLCPSRRVGECRIYQRSRKVAHRVTEFDSKQKRLVSSILRALKFFNVYIYMRVGFD